MISKYPESFARFYDTIYHSQRDTVDNQYFRDLALKADGKVLEIGVGTGRLFMNALTGGADIYGLDISESMLDVLYKKLPADQHYRISQQSITDFSFDFRFDLIMAPFRVFMHLPGKDEQILALNNVYRHLGKNGKFVFDTFVPDLNQLLNGFNNFTDFEGEYETGKLLRRRVTTTPDLIQQVINIKFHLDWEESSGMKHDVWETPLRFFFRYELEHLVERSSFKKYKIFGDYQCNELNSQSKEFVVICEK